MADPAEPADSADSSEPVEPVEPTGVAEAGETAELGESGAAAEAAEPAETGEAGGLVEPAEARAAAEGGTSTGPGASAEDDSSTEADGSAASVTPLEQALHAARALVLADLMASEVAEADVVSLVEESLTQRRWWVEQWPEGADFLAGLVAQDVQDALLERQGRWPLCPSCGSGDPHALDVEPELGPDPHWVCHEAGIDVAPVGHLGHALGGNTPA